MKMQMNHTSKTHEINRLSIGTKLYLSVLLLFLVFAVAFIVFQQYREKQYKVATLNLRLQDNNERLHDILVRGDKPKDFPHSTIRVTIISRDGRVLFDSNSKDYAAMGNHSGRPEVIQALRQGSGSSVERNSTTLRHDYFYSATYYPHDGYIIRSALPYNNDLARNLQADQHYIWFALAILLLLTMVLYHFTSRLGKNITKLNEFANRIATSKGTLSGSKKNDILSLEGLGEALNGFSNDELGDTAERIVKLYIKLQHTQQEQDVLKRQLTQNVAHELKTPVASIQGYLETILENPHIDDATRDQFLDRCYAQSKRLASLLADMSTLNRLDDGADMMTFENVDVAEIIRTVQKESQLALEQKNMTMRCDIPTQIIIHGNRSLIYSIFRNLTDNAIAYAGRGKHITLECTRDKENWHFIFSDDGTGVAPEHLSRLFERFYRVDKGRSRKMGGTGLGLAIVKNAVRVHGGTIAVNNNPTGGLRFDFTLK